MTALPVKTIVTRDHQRELADEAVAILARSPHAYVEAPPAAGKTLVLALVANDLPYEQAYYLAHTVDLVDQARREVATYREQGLVRENLTWHFMTRAAYNNMVKARARTPGGSNPAHATFVDECHMGGVARSGAAKKQFPAVIATSAKVVWISATPWQLDEDMMGARNDNTSALSYEEAFEKGLLNDTDLVRVDCGLDLRVKLSPEVRDARQLHRSEGAEYVVAAETAEGQHRALDDIVREAVGRGLRTTDVPTLVRYRWELMAKLYLRRHRGERAIFWLPSKQHARDCAAHLNEVTGRDDFAEAVLGEHPGTAEAEADRSAIADWMDPGGRMKIVCVVYRLREGFDYPALAHGFDCSWNPYNYRNSVQKIGRLTRTATDKPRGRYYYAVDAVTIAGARSRRFSKRFLEALGRAYNEEDLTMTADAFDDARSMVAALGMDVARHEAMPELDNVDIGDRSLRIATTPMFGIVKAGRVEVSRPLSFEDLLEQASMSAVEKLVHDIERGRRAMPPIAQRGEGSMIRRVVTPSSDSYREDLRRRLIACGAIKPKERAWMDARRRMKDLVADLEQGVVTMQPGGEEHRFLFKYFNQANKNFQPAVRARLLACGAITGRGRGPLGSIERPDVYAQALRLEALHPEEGVKRIASRIVDTGGLHKATIRGYVEKARRERMESETPAEAPTVMTSADLRVVVLVRGPNGMARFEQVLRALDVAIHMGDALNVRAIAACVGKQVHEDEIQGAVDRVVASVVMAAIDVAINDLAKYRIDTFEADGVKVTVASDPQEPEPTGRQHDPST